MMGVEDTAVFENLASLAAGMATGQIYKIMSVYCPHRKKMVLQQVHDNNRTQPRHDDDSDDRQIEQPQPAASNAEEGWAQLAMNNSTTDTKSITNANQTPEDTLKIHSTDSVIKKLEPEFNDELTDSKLRLMVAEHVQAIYEPKISELQQLQREQNLAHETEIRRLNTILQKKTERNDDKDENKRTEALPAEAALDARVDSAEELRQKRTGEQNCAQQIAI